MLPSRGPHPQIPSLRTATIVGVFARMVVALDRGRLSDASTAQRRLSKLGFVVTPKPIREPEGGVQ